MPRSHLHGDLTIHVSGRSDDGAPTLVLLHGLTDAGACWADAVQRWSDDYRLVAWDARGHGDSARFAEGQLEDGVGETHLADAIALLENLARQGIDRPVVIGHSMGGGTAAAVAGLRPDLVRAVVLEDPALGARTDHLADAEDDARAAAAARVAELRAALADPGAVAMRMDRDHPTWPALERPLCVQALLDTDLVMLGQEHVLLRSPRFATAANLAAPTLLVTGDTDVIWGPPMLAHLAGLGNVHVETAIVTGAGHCVRRDVGDGFHAIVDPWVAERFGEA